MGTEKIFDVAEKAQAAAVGGRTFSVMPSALPESTALVRLVHPATALADETLRIATRIRLAVSDTDRSIAFTGPALSDLASELAQDMSLAFSQFAPGQVLLVAAGKQREDLQELGLTDVIAGKCSLQNALIEPADGGPWLLPAGNLEVDRSHLYFSTECAMLLSALGQRFRHVFVDAGPLNAPASLVIIARCDAVAVAVAAGPHRKKDLIDVQQELARIKTKLLGVVLTRTERQGHKPW